MPEKSKTKKERLRYPVHWLERKNKNEKISLLTVYDASFARLLSRSKINALLVGDSLGMTLQGHDSTLPVRMRDMIYHCSMVRRGAPDLFIIGDMPFASYQVSTEQAVRKAMRLVQKGKVDAVKVEGSHSELLRAIEKLNYSGVPVMGHIGLTPQSCRNTAGFKIQGRDPAAAKAIAKEALALQEAGCFALVLELLFHPLSKEITESLKIPTIGIGSGPHTSGQVLVLHDFLGLDPDFSPKHAQAYLQMGSEIINAANSYHRDVQEGRFPLSKT